MGPARINNLSPEVANQIAAGEVVERPASVVKELVENSIDAGATELSVDIEQAGSRLIRVSDNGSGIAKDDLVLATQSHATSKITTSADLSRIHTLGFRGEALASIASVSRFTIASRCADEEHGWAYSLSRLAGAEAPLITPTPMALGTVIDVRDLFFSVPARRKFLRSERTEAKHIEEVMRRVLLSSFGIGIAFRIDKRTVFQISRAVGERQIRERLDRVFGAKFSARARRIDIDLEDITVHGWIGDPADARGQAEYQFLYVNGRSIRDTMVRHALRTAYEDTLHPGHYPVFALFLTLDPSRIDVNVHPTKHEVRFRDARQVHDLLVSVVRQSLKGTTSASPSMDLSDPPSQSNPPKRTETLSQVQVRETFSAYRYPTSDRRQETTYVRREEPSRQFNDFFQNILGFIGNHLLLVKTEAGSLGIVNLHALMAEFYRQRFQSMIRARGEVSQPLLIPVVMDLNEALIAHLNAICTQIELLGVEFRVTEGHRVALSHVPASLRQADAKAVLEVVIRFAKDSDVTAFLNALAELAIGESPTDSLAVIAAQLQKFDGDPLSAPFGCQLPAQALCELIMHGVATS